MMIFNYVKVMNPRASDSVRCFQDTIIVAGDVRLTLNLTATLGAEMNITS